MENIYNKLKDPKYSGDDYEKVDLNDEMFLIKERMYGYWKPRYLIDEHNQYACEFMDAGQRLCTVTEDDIVMESLAGLDEECITRAKNRSFHFPSNIFKFKNDVAKVRWQLNPDGRYYMDGDGYGMTDDQEVNIYGFIDRRGGVVVKFRYVDEDDIMLDVMEMNAGIEVIQRMFKK